MSDPIAPNEPTDASASTDAPAKNTHSLAKLSHLVDVLSTCSCVGEALAAVRRSDPLFDVAPSDTHGDNFPLKKVQDHGAMASVSGQLRDTIAGPEFDVLIWSSPAWPKDGLGCMNAAEVLETLAMKAEYTKFKTLEEQLESLASIEDVDGTMFVRAEEEVCMNTTAILVGLLFGKKTDCSSSFITWVYKTQMTLSSVQFSDGVCRALLLRASQATRTRYYSPDAYIGASHVPFLIKRFHYELRRRFDYRRSSSEYEKDPMGVCEAVCNALCSQHMDQEEFVEPLLAVLYIRRGNCAMRGDCAKGKRSLPCVLCLYGTRTPAKVKYPMIYSNKLIEDGETIEADLKTIDEREVQADFCDRWSYKLLSLLFSGNWNAMECAVYKSVLNEPKVPVIAGQRLRTILKKVLGGQTNLAILEGVTPWVVFEVCQSYGLSASHFIQSMYDCSVKLVNSGDENVRQKVDRILGGIASIYDYRKLMSADMHNIRICSERGGITGCLYLYNGMGDSLFAERYIFHRWLMERAYKWINAQNDLRAIELWCSICDIAMKRTGQRLTFGKRPFWTLTGVLEEKSKGCYHYRVDDEMPTDDILCENVVEFDDQRNKKMTFICT